MNHDAVVKLFSEIEKVGTTHIYIPDKTTPTMVSSQKTGKEISQIADFDKHKAEVHVVGSEGSNVLINSNLVM